MDYEEVNQISQNLFLTSFSGACEYFKRNESARKNFTCIIVARELIPISFKILCENVVCISLDDSLEQDLMRWFDFVIDLVDSRSAPTMIVCKMGISRSASFCIAYFMKTHHYSLTEAYDFVKSKRNIIYPNPNFLKQLRQYYDGLFRQSVTKYR